MSELPTPAAARLRRGPGWPQPAENPPCGHVLESRSGINEFKAIPLGSGAGQDVFVAVYIVHMTANPAKSELPGHGHRWRIVRADGNHEASDIVDMGGPRHHRQGRFLGEAAAAPGG